MKEIISVIKSMINISDDEMKTFLSKCKEKSFPRHALVSSSGKIPQEIFFIRKGLIRVMILDAKGIEHTLHFAMENQFIADYSAFIQHRSSGYFLRTEEPTDTIILNREAVEWGYKNLQEGNKFGRLIAEYYFVYQDNRIQNMYSKTPKERYDNITLIFPEIHNRVPQHMIASYLGITPVHLSRLKNQNK